MSDEIVLDQIRGDLIGQAWPLMEPFFARACRRVPTHLTPALILYRAQTRQSDLWAIFNKACPLPLLAAASTAQRGSIMTIESIGGRDMKSWLRPALARFEQLAREHGITEIEIEGRFSWQRLLPEYNPVRIALRKML